jgi:pimeloyl-ACP methyl ester carboxylesterase
VDTVKSSDGTAIAFERAGSGPPLILVDAAGHYRAFSSFDGLVGRLAAAFTVYHYDRRGRGDSGDTDSYAVAREVDDLAALIVHAGGGPAFLYGYSSGALVAIHAAASGLPVARIALLEPPIETGGGGGAEQAAFTARLAELVAAGRRDAAVEHFMSGIGVPADIVDQMRDSPQWTAMVAVAHTLVYDGILSGQTSPATLAAVPVPALVLSSGSSDDGLTAMAAAAAATMPHGVHRVVPGDWHGVADDVLAAELADYFAS